MIMGREQIGTLIPHAGTMRLLDAVLAWDDRSIRCTSTRHRDPQNPLRRDGRLGGLAAIEFAAQAMAIHGRLSEAVNERPRAGYLASLRDIVCRCLRLDDRVDDLTIDVEHLAGDGALATYGFSVAAGAEVLVTGRATVLLRPLNDR
jgi:predicted hotdog family 3-hydroxylacyl-ACP dehydratase